MPRQPISLPYQLEHLSILDEEGHLDGDLEPDIPEELLMRIFRTMLLTRRLDERMLDLQRQGRIGTFGPVKGHEAAHLGSVAVLRESDWMVPAFRETGAELWRGKPVEDVLLYWSGYDEGARVAEGRNDLPICVPIGSQVPHAAGIGYAIKYRKRDEIVLSFFGDGATSEGDFHEGMNFAAVFQVPAVFVIQNNQWAISIPRWKQTRAETLAQKAIAYGIQGIQVDGNDVLAVYAATLEAAERARAGGGPTVVEAVTYRLVMHTTADDPKRYRSDEEVAIWEKRDPLPRFQKYLKDKGLLSDESAAQVEAEVKAEIQGAVERFEKMKAELGDPLHMFENVYAEVPPHLSAQREQLRLELEEMARTGAAEDGTLETGIEAEIKDVLERAEQKLRSTTGRGTSHG